MTPTEFEKKTFYVVKHLIPKCNLQAISLHDFCYKKVNQIEKIVFILCSVNIPHYKIHYIQIYIFRVVTQNLNSFLEFLNSSDNLPNEHTVFFYKVTSGVTG